MDRRSAGFRPAGAGMILVVPENAPSSDPGSTSNAPFDLLLALFYNFVSLVYDEDRLSRSGRNLAVDAYVALRL